MAPSSRNRRPRLRRGYRRAVAETAPRAVAAISARAAHTSSLPRAILSGAGNRCSGARGTDGDDQRAGAVGQGPQTSSWYREFPRPTRPWKYPRRMRPASSRRMIDSHRNLACRPGQRGFDRPYRFVPLRRRSIIVSEAISTRKQ